VEVSSFIKATPWHGLLFAKKRLLLAHMHDEAKKIRVTNEMTKLDVALCHLTDSVCNCGQDIPNTLESSLVCNYNESYVRWSHNMTTKQIHHMKNKYSVCEWVQDSSLRVLHVKGKINLYDIFTEQMQDGAHF
jgi:hypothetical protein